MLDEIISLIDKIYQEQAEKRQAELKVLQAQIKPHFLYNTLDNLKWMAKAQGADEVAKAITSLSTYFRIFLSNGQEKITLAQEFKHTEAYLTMQKIRYGQKLNSTLELAEDARDLPMLKILIQPLVENAINHGLKPKETGGTIQVSARLIEDRLEIQVRDDGVGMDEATLAALREALQKEQMEGHYGLQNVLRRCRIEYGEKACLSIDSTLGAGTCVTLTLPVGGKEESV